MITIQHSDRVSALLFKKQNPFLQHYNQPEGYFSLVPDDFDTTSLTIAPPEIQVDNLYILTAEYGGYALYQYIRPELKNQEIATIDFKTALVSGTTLKERPLITNGKLDEKVFFINYDPATFIYSNPVVRITYNYIFTNNILTEINKTIEWYQESGSIGPDSKNIGQVFHPVFDRYIIVKEMKKIRERFIYDLELEICDLAKPYGGFGSEIDAFNAVQSFLSAKNNEINIFTNHGDIQQLTDAVSNDNTPWVLSSIGSSTIKDEIISKLNNFSL